MSEWEAPAKINLDLRLRPPDRSGLHPLHSYFQAVEWLDRLVVEEGDEDGLVVEGADLPDDEDNLVWKAVAALDLRDRPPLHMELHKSIAVAAGLGGGSSDAAAALAAVGEMLSVDPERIRAAAPRVGADVPFFLTGGTALVEGHGEQITPVEPLSGFAVAIVVPPFELATPEVYRRWDELDGPTGPELAGSDLPPPLRRRFDELRNDLVPAAVSLRPELADWMHDLGEAWEQTVLMSGSGPACFGFFLDVGEAEDALDEVEEHRAAKAAELRTRGVGRLED